MVCLIKFIYVCMYRTPTVVNSMIEVNVFVIEQQITMKKKRKP